ncbi:MAG: SDR family NAD(P)-dependent oxidoreductase [Anaerolineales bacterium]|nr:SDR family NAD(P)-dependent oxidoreductase [Anaerolineales bacterium]
MTKITESVEIPVARPLEPQGRAIVIGASSGLGAALTQELARRGYVVAALARRFDELAVLCEQINDTAVSHKKNGAPHGRAIPVAHDATDYEAIPALFHDLVQEMGGLDLIIYNAGVMPPVGPDEYDFAKDYQMVSVNLLGAMAWLNLAAVRFQQAGKGRIVGISSVAGDRGRRNNPGYQTSKGGLSVYLESLRNRLSQYGVNVTTIKPGFIDTQMLDNAPKTFWVISPEEAAKRLVTAVEKNRQTVYLPARWGLVMLIIRHIPSFIFRRLSI